VATVEHYSEPFPWRTATYVASAIAALELLGLVGVGAFVVAHPFRHHGTTATTASSTTPAVTTPATTAHHVATVARRVAPIPAKDRVAPVAPHPIRARSQVRVLVLNANGVQGAAHSEAAHLQGLGYPIGGAANAPSHHYSQSMVMFVPGYAKEARRLARDTGIKLVAPVDGLTQSALSGSRLVVLLGS
jgi:LytR cell envelope-related transcriptional attenuator